MELTGKCKEDFSKWLQRESIEQKDFCFGWQIFYQLPESMQFGVYVEFFDSVGIHIETLPVWNYGTLDFDFGYIIKYLEGDFRKGVVNEKEIFHRSDARIFAIQKANGIYNSRQ